MDYLQKFLTYLRIERDSSENTIRTYRMSLERWLAYIGDDLLTATRDQARTYIARRRAEGLSESSVRTGWMAVRSFYKFLRIDGVIQHSAVELVTLKVSKERLPKVISLQDLDKILNAPKLKTTKGRRDRAIMQLLYASGIRAGELSALTMDMVNFDQNEMRVIGKGDKERIVPLFDPTHSILRDWVERFRPKYDKKNLPYLFLTNQGDKMSYNTILAMVKNYAAQVGASSNVTPHAFRHTIATQLLDGNMDLRTLQEFLGHNDITTTTIYTHVSKERTKASYLKATQETRVTNTNG